MRTLWTPDGEHAVAPASRPAERPPSAAPSAGDAQGAGAASPAGAAVADVAGAVDGAASTAELDELTRQIASTPAATVLANHCYGFFELAALHLGSDPPHLHDAQLAIDALGAVLDGLPGRLGDPEAQLREALTQIRLAFVRIEGAGRSAGGAPASGSEPGTS